jgi:uncharacterized damage-inducible protein DinB
MNAIIVNQIIQRDLNRLKNELLAYQEEKRIWQVESGIANSAGNLCLHLAGNLNTYIGMALGGIEYVRERDLEFSRKDVPRTELVDMIGHTMAVVQAALEKLTEEQLAEDFPMLVLDERTSTGFMLIHLTAHLNYHLGQVNYHRRLLDRR